MINDILDFSKIEAGKVRVESAPMNLNALLADVVQLLQPARGKKVCNYGCITRIVSLSTLPATPAHPPDCPQSSR